MIHGVRSILDVLEARVTHQTSQLRDNGKLAAIGRESALADMERVSKGLPQLPAGRAVINTLIEFGQAQYAARAQNAFALSYQGRPCRWSHKAKQGTRIDKVEGVVSKIKRIERVHNIEMRVIESSHPRISVCVFNHRLADINSCHLNLRVGASYIKHPAAGAAGDVKN